MNLESALYNHPLLKHAKLSNDGMDFFKEFYTLMKAVHSLEKPSDILKNIIASKLYTGIIELLATQRGTT